MQENEKVDDIEPSKKKRPDGSTLAEDQAEHSYYYDDSHGYEEYDPDEEDFDD